jgi:hypothetical protein
MVLAGVAQAAPLRIVSPRPDTVVPSGGLRLAVRAARGVRVVLVTVGGVDVTKRLRRRGQRAFGATVPRGVLPNGLLRVAVFGRMSGRTVSRHVRVIAGMRSRSLLAITRSGRQRDGPFELGLLVRGRIRVLAGSLNRRQLRRPLGGPLPGRHDVSLSASDGLHFGRNELVVVGARAGGTYDVERRSLVIGRDGPLAGAGTDPVTVPGRGVRLSGRASKPDRTGARLSYRWRIVRKPRGSRARLSRPRSVTPGLRPDRAGRYRVQLTVTEWRRGQVSRRRARDSVVATAVANYPPLGAAFATNRQAEFVPFTSVGAPIGGKAVGYPEAQENIQILALDRATLEEMYSQPFVGAASEVPTLVSTTLPKLGAGTLVVLSHPRAEGVDPEWNQVLAAIGSPQLSQAQLNGPWTAVGVPGQAPGTAWVNPGYPVAGGGEGLGQVAAGGLRGFLQLSTSPDAVIPGYSFVPDIRVPFDTAPSPGAMRVGGQTYPVSLPAGASAGFEVLVIDPSLSPQQGAPLVFGVNTGGAGQDASAQQAMASALQQAAATSGVTVFIQSIGNPKPTTPTWDAIAEQVAMLGGSEHVFDTLNGSGGYALVGGPGLEPGEAMEASQPLTGQIARITGVLTPDSTAQLAPFAAYPAGTLDLSLLTLANGPATPFPATGTAALANAETYVAQQLDIEPGAGSCYQPLQQDVRSSHCNLNINWSSKLGELSGITYPSSPNPGFEPSDLTAVVDALTTEFPQVDAVNRMIANLQAPFGNANQAAAIDLAKITGEISGQFNPSRNGTVQATVFGVISGLLTALAYIPVSDFAAAPVIGVIGSAFASEAALANLPDGSPVLGEIQTTAGMLGTELSEDYLTASIALGQLGDLLVTDPVKLSTAAANASGSWGISNLTVQSAEATLILATKQFVYGRLLPVAYTAWEFSTQLPINQANCGQQRSPPVPWKNAPTGSYMTLVVGLGGSYPNPQPQTVYLALAGGDIYSDATGAFVIPSTSLIDPLFQPPAAGGGGGFGLFQTWFFLNNFTPQAADCV